MLSLLLLSCMPAPPDPAPASQGDDAAPTDGSGDPGDTADGDGAAVRGDTATADTGDEPEQRCASIALGGEPQEVVLAETDNALGLENALTVSAWVWVDPSAGGEFPTFLDLEASFSSTPARNTGVYLGAGANGELQLFYGTGTEASPDTWTVSTGSRLPYGAWVHVVGTRDGERVRLYQDGELVHEASSMPTGDLSFEGEAYETEISRLGRFDRGANDFDDHRNLVGRLSQVAVWSRALTEVEIQEVLAGNPGDVSTGLAGWWPLDDGEGATVNDAGPHGLDGALVPATDGPVWIEDCP